MHQPNFPDCWPHGCSQSQRVCLLLHVACEKLAGRRHLSWLCVWDATGALHRHVTMGMAVCLHRSRADWRCTSGIAVGRHLRSSDFGVPCPRVWGRVEVALHTL